MLGYEIIVVVDDQVVQMLAKYYVRLRNGWNLMNEKKGFVAVGCAKRFIGKPDIKAKFFFLYWLFTNAGRHNDLSVLPQRKII